MKITCRNILSLTLLCLGVLTAQLAYAERVYIEKNKKGNKVIETIDVIVTEVPRYRVTTEGYSCPDNIPKVKIRVIRKDENRLGSCKKIQDAQFNRSKWRVGGKPLCNFDKTFDVYTGNIGMFSVCKENGPGLVRVQRRETLSLINKRGKRVRGIFNVGPVKYEIQCPATLPEKSPYPNYPPKQLTYTTRDCSKGECPDRSSVSSRMGSGFKVGSQGNYKDPCKKN